MQRGPGSARSAPNTSPGPRRPAGRYSAALLLPIGLLVAAHATSSLALAGPAEYQTGSVTIQLNTGLNLVSVSVATADTDVASFFGPLGSALREASAYDAATRTWQTYAPSAPSFLNTLSSVAPGQALALLMDAPAILEISGEPLDSLELQTEPGWNLIGDNGLAPRAPETVFDGVADGLSGVFRFDAGDWTSFVPGVPPGPDPITDIDPGVGYWVIRDTPVEWFFDSVVYHSLRTRADLVVEDIWNSREAAGGPLEHESLTLYAWVGNQGYQPAANVATNFYKRVSGSGGDYEFIGQDTSTIIAAGDRTLYSISVPGGFSYRTVVMAVADEGSPVGLIPELNERNNRRTEQIYIRMPDPDLTGGLSFSPAYPFTDSTVTLTIDVINGGDADADGFAVQFRLEDDNESTLWSEDIRFGPGGGSVLTVNETRTLARTVALSSYTSGPGDYRFVVQIDPASELQESDERNNAIYWNRYVSDPPELTLDEPSYCCWNTPRGPRVGDAVRVAVSVANEGASEATNVKATYDDTSDAGGGQWSQGAQTIIPDIPSGWMDHTHNTLQNVAAGTHVVEILVEYTEEEPPRDVQLTLPDLSVRDLLPDVWPTGIRVDQDYPNVGSSPQFTADIYNSDREADADPFTVGFYYTQADPWTDADLTSFGSAAVGGGIPMGQEVSVTATWSAPPPGEFIVVARADPGDSLAEVWDENNDLELRGVLIRDTGPDLMPVQLGSEPRNPMVNQESRLEASVVNAGDTQATFDTTFYRQQGATQTEIGTASGTTIDAGATSTVSVSWTPDEEGRYQIVAVVDPGDAVSESLEANNEFTRRINVRPRPYYIEITDDGVFVDRAETAADWGQAGARGLAWCYSDVREGCSWDTWWGVPYYNCDFQDRSSIRVARYTTFRVGGPEGDATLADISTDLQILGLIDSLYHPLTGSAYWSLKSVAGVFQGPVDSSTPYNMNYPIVSTDPPLLDVDSGALWQHILQQGTVALAGELCGPTCAPLLVASIALDSLTADVLVFEKGTLDIDNVTLRTGQEYTVFVYVDLVTAAVGASSFCYSDFYYHDPHNDLQAKEFLRERGVWLYNVEVDFK